MILHLGNNGLVAEVHHDWFGSDDYGGERTIIPNVKTPSGSVENGLWFADVHIENVAIERNVDREPSKARSSTYVEPSSIR